MLKISSALFKKYDRLLINSDIPPQEYPACRKWLRFYLDFCKKYHRPYADSESLPPFIDKLKSKKQNAFQQNQARKAVGLYYSGMDRQASAPITEQDHSRPTPSIREEVRPFTKKEESNPWGQSIRSLKNEIEVRHYSKKTLKAYSLWTEKLRYFVKDKPPGTLTVEDVKAFLTFLAVKKKVSASSQNQAFTRIFHEKKKLLFKTTINSNIFAQNIIIFPDCTLSFSIRNKNHSLYFSPFGRV